MTTIQDDDHMGWTNRETWNVQLWISNTEPLYRLLWDHILPPSNNVGDFADALQHLLNILWDGKTPDEISLMPVDWSQIAESWWKDFNEEDIPI